MPKQLLSIEDPVILEAALEGLEAQKQRIEAQLAEIRARLAKRQPSSTSPTTFSTRRALSPEARKRIANAQKKRWAEYRKANAGPK